MTPEDVNRCFKIFGKDAPTLKGHTVRRKGKRVVLEVMNVPRYILDKNKKVTLDGDHFFTNKLIFFVTLSRNIEFNTIQHYPKNRDKGTMLDGLKAVLRLYGARGFVVRIFNADNEFECLRQDLLELGVVLNIASANEHCPFIKRRIRWIKEKARSVRHNLPYAVMPKLMIVELLYFVVHWLNPFQQRMECLILFHQAQY